MIYLAYAGWLYLSYIVFYRLPNVTYGFTDFIGWSIVFYLLSRLPYVMGIKRPRG